MDEYTWENEADGVIELFIVGIICMIGLCTMMWMVLTFSSRVDSFERFDKVSAEVMYDDAVLRTYKFTPCQTYLMGYGIDEWNPDGTSIRWYKDSDNQVKMIAATYKVETDRIHRDNTVSGAWGTTPSVRGVLDAIRDERDYADFYRGQILILDWTSNVNKAYNTYLDDGITIFEANKRDYEWVVKQ